MVYFIDTSIFLEVELKQQKKEESKEFLKKVWRNEIKALTTDFNVDATVIIMQNKKAKLRTIQNFLIAVTVSEGLTIYDVNLVDRFLALSLVKKHKLKYDDALNYFTMRSLGIKEIVSFDSDYDKLPGIKRIEPKDILRK